MTVAKTILLVVAIIAVPLLTFFLIRLTLKFSRGVDHLNRTLDDARPQLNMLLSNLNRTLEDVNGELERVGELTGEAQEMMELAAAGLRSVEEALGSRLARLAGMLAGFATTTIIFRGLAKRLAPGGRDARDGEGHG